MTGSVSGQGVPKLCGSLSGQHVIYTPVTNIPSKLSVMTMTGAPPRSSSMYCIHLFYLIIYFSETSFNTHAGSGGSGLYSMSASAP